MVLSRPDLLRRIAEGSLRFDPPVLEDAVAQVSIDLRLGRTFTTFKHADHGHVEVVNPKAIFAKDMWETVERDEFDLQPKQFVLAQTLETVTIPHDLVGFVEGRSGVARLGIGVHLTAPKIDPGFSAPIVLEMTNHGPKTVRLRVGESNYCQLILMSLSSPLGSDEAYGSRPGDVFQHQKSAIPERPRS